VLGVWLLLAVGSALVLAQAQGDSRHQTERRFEARAATTASFVETYVSDFAAQERRVARRGLAGRTVSRSSFEQVVGLLGSDTAVLLDGNGTSLEVAPRAPRLLGTNLSRYYPHLNAAVHGRLGISDAVLSVVRHIPVVAFAVPYRSAAGRRVLSSAFPIGSTPLGTYLRRAGALAPNRVFLIDRRGMVLAGNGSAGGQTLAVLAPTLARALRSGTRAGHSADGEYFSVQPVPGTPWRLVMSAPAASLYQAVRGSKRLVPWLLWLGFVAGGLGCVVLVRRLIASGTALRTTNAQLDLLARVDTLTGLPNRRSIEELLRSTLAAATRYGHDAAVLMVDVDHFKRINDSYGHAGGDDVLNAVADCLRANLRDGDVVGRWGGEEFMVVMPYTDSEGAEVVADRMREVVAESPMVASGEPVLVTISIGCAAWQADEEMGALLHRTDAALYQAKERGRNRVVSAEAHRARRAASTDAEPRVSRPAPEAQVPAS
jgi:diguanylate cyclase (GGDEF)-like protein